MTETHRRFAFPIFLLLGLTAGCGGDVVLPDEGEAAELEIVSGDEQLGPAGTTLAQQVVVRVLDTRSRPVANQDVTFTIGSGGGSVEPTTVKSSAAGQAAASWTLGPNSGSHLLRVQTPRGGSGTLEVSVQATAVAGSGSVLLEAGGNDQTGPVSSALADSLVVKATDALGNPVAGVEVTWSVSGGGSISPTTVATGADGLAAAERVLGPTAGAQSAQASVEGFTGSPVTFTHTAVPANPTALVLVSGDDQIAPGGFEVAEDLVVRLEDGSGNGIGERPITWVVPSGSGSVNPVNTTTDANGLATTRWTLPSAVGSYSVSAVFSGLPPVTFTATATADVPTTIEMVSGNNQSAIVGSAVANPLVVRVTDASDNPVANVGVAWTAEGGGSVSAANTATDASGLAQVTRTVGLLPGPYTTTAAVNGLSGSPITFTSTATVGPPAQLALLTQPGSPTISGEAFDPAPVIQVQDAFGNSVSQGGITVTAAISSGQAATLVNEQQNTNSNGRARFNNLEITGPPDDDYVLTFSASFEGSPLIPVSSVLLTVTAGGASAIEIQQQPSSTVQNGLEFPQQPVVQVVDETGNPVDGDWAVTVAIQSGAGTLDGTLTVNSSGGATVTFTDLQITGALGDRTLRFTSGVLSGAVSSPITVTLGPPASIAIHAGDDQTAGVGQELPTDPAVIVRDPGGIPVPGVDVAFAVTPGDGSVTPTTVPTGGDGVAATNWTLGMTADENTMTATVAGLSPVTFSATATASPTTTSLSAEPPSPSTSGETVTFTATVTNSGGTPTGDVTFREGTVDLGTSPLVSGVATFPTSALEVGSHSITAHYPGDGTFGASESAPLSYEVASANTAPTAEPDAFNVAEDASLSVLADGVLANDSDADGDDLTAQLVTGPLSAEGFALAPDGSFGYAPIDDFNGSDSFSYRANDGQENSNTVVVAITIDAIDDPPEFTVGPDVEVSALLTALGYVDDDWASGISPGPPDEAGQTVEFEVSTDSPSAFLVLPTVSSDGTLEFTPAARVDQIIVTATTFARDSGGVESEPQTFTITINP